jgi:hypothetical protein
VWAVVERDGFVIGQLDGREVFLKQYGESLVAAGDDGGRAAGDGAMTGFIEFVAVRHAWLSFLVVGGLVILALNILAGLLVGKSAPSRNDVWHEGRTRRGRRR